MAFNTNQAANTGSFVPTTNVWDVGQIYSVENIDVGLRDLLVRLYQNLGFMSTALNNKVSGYFPLQEFLTSALYFNLNSTDPNQLRNEFITVVNTGALSSTTSYTPAHGITITPTWNLVQLYGAATDNIGNHYYPMPYTQSGGTANISLSMNATDILITNGTAINFTSSMVIVKYVKN